MRTIQLAAGLLGFSGVALGAFGAHGLKTLLAEQGTTDIWQKAVLYHLVHAVAVWAIAARVPSASSSWSTRTAWCWTAGVGFFSGSLYGLALGGPRWLGPITPLGGLAFLAGWALIAWDGLRKDVS